MFLKKICIVVCFFSRLALAIAYGTAPRIESEFKKTYYFSTDVNYNEIQKSLLKKLGSKDFLESLKLSRIVKRPYSFDKTFKEFVFKDYYLDTINLSLMKNHIEYRLRYRWDSSTRFYLYRYLSFLSSFHPNRCEIQLKDSYEFNDRTGIVNAIETRFEFRNESAPFSRSFPAPKAPWDKKLFITFAQNGSYENLRMLPYHRLKAILFPRYGIKESELTESVEVDDFRIRAHFHLDTPWGSGPNPSQIFIVTIDRVSANSSRKNLNVSNGRFVEVEIEMERNVSTGIRAAIESSRRHNRVWELDELKLAEEAYLSDLVLISSEVSNVMDTYLRPMKSPLVNKYRRIVKGN